MAAVYGGLTWATDSILPAVALHAGGDVWSLGRLWLTGRPEWQRTDVAPEMVWNSGVDASFLWTLGLFLAFTAATTGMYRHLRGIVVSAGSPLATSSAASPSAAGVPSSPQQREGG